MATPPNHVAKEVYGLKLVELKFLFRERRREDGERERKEEKSCILGGTTDQIRDWKSYS